ncbi:MAG: hypothetical protein PHW93_07170, partial [Candidatus Methanomethylophilaceae archaeon]|nr:hypothetical protein [Candidatus Methanomethylophilaceae archaeon]
MIKSEPSQVSSIIEDFIGRDHSIFKRLALNTISNNYNDFQNIFWKFKGNPFEVPEIKAELYYLLEKNCLLFSTPEQNKLVARIESIDFSWLTEKNLGPLEIEMYKAQSKKTWLNALVKTNNPVILEKIQEYNKISPEEITSPIQEDVAYAHFLDSSPIEAESELLRMTNEDIVKYLNNFQEEGFFKPTKIGLAETLKRVVSLNPKKFTDNILPFSEIPRIYIRGLLWGFLDAWRTKREINWSII